MYEDWVEMTGGGSHRANARLMRLLDVNHVRCEYKGRALPAPGSKTFWSSKRVAYRVHPDDVNLAHMLGLTVRRK